MSDTNAGDDGIERGTLPLASPEIAALGGALVAVAGTLLPWQVTSDGVTVGLEVNGFLAILLALTVVATVAVLQGARTSGRVAVGGGALIVLLSAHWIGVVSGLLAAGTGVYVTLAGGLAALLGGVVRLRRSG